MRRSAALTGLVFVLCSVGWAAETPVAVSPGSPTGSLIGDTCPTFSWGAVSGAKSYELVVYRLGEENEEARPVLRQSIAGSALGWTPSLPDCLEPGRLYAWSVKAAGLAGESEWTEASLFEVFALPSVAEAEEATPVPRGDALAASPQWTGAQFGTEAIQGSRDEPTERVMKLQPLRSESLGASELPPPGIVIRLGSYALSIDGDFNLGGSIWKEGTPFLHNDGGSLGQNTALGLSALINSTPGFPSALSGYFNTALGAGALRSNTAGSGNTATGLSALNSNETGLNNTATGVSALHFNTIGTHNTAIGVDALFVNTSGVSNTAVGWESLENSTGSGNIALGAQAGSAMTSGDDNIFIGNTGLATENKTIRIGSGTHTQTFLGGISGQMAGGTDPVLIGGNAKLGSMAPSSRRFKENIHDLGDLSDKLQGLRVVSFRYTKEVLGSAQPRPEFGLIAEEVAEIFPELVVYDAEGQPSSVRYHLLSSILLDELQKQHWQNQLQWIVLGAMLLAGVSVEAGRWRLA